MQTTQCMRECYIINVLPLPHCAQPPPSHHCSPRLRSALSLSLFIIMGRHFTPDQLKRGAVVYTGGTQLRYKYLHLTSKCPFLVLDCQNHSI